MLISHPVRPRSIVQYYMLVLYERTRHLGHTVALWISLSDLQLLEAGSGQDPVL